MNGAAKLSQHEHNAPDFDTMKARETENRVFDKVKYNSNFAEHVNLDRAVWFAYCSRYCRDTEYQAD